MKKELKRLQFDFSQEVLQRINTLQEKTDAKSRSAVIKDAIEAYDKLLSIADFEDRIEVVDSRGKLVFKGPAKLIQ